MSKMTGYLTIYSVDRAEIYGECADAEWDTDIVRGEKVHTFIGTASDGTLETFLRLDNAGVSHVAYSFDSHGFTYVGAAELLAPKTDEPPSHAQIRLETGVAPVAT